MYSSSRVLCILQAFHHLTFKSSRFYLFSHYFDSHNNQISTIYCRHAMDCAPQLLATNATSHKLTSHNLFTISTWAKPAVLRVYVENQAILERILLDHALKCKQTKEQGSRDCLWTYIFTFLRNYYTFFFSFFHQDANIIGLNCAIIDCNLSKKHKLALSQTQSAEPNYIDHKILL